MISQLKTFLQKRQKERRYVVPGNLNTLRHLRLDRVAGRIDPPWRSGYLIILHIEGVADHLPHVQVTALNLPPGRTVVLVSDSARVSNLIETTSTGDELPLLHPEPRDHVFQHIGVLKRVAHLMRARQSVRHSNLEPQPAI